MRLNLKRHGIIGAATLLILGVLALLLVAAGGIAAWEYSNSDAFCASMCHSVHPEEIASHKTASHASVHCVECHMGRNSTLKLIAMKPTHFKELYGMVFGYERPLHASGMRPAREACESCHNPQTEHHDSIIVKKRYGDDPKSSEIDYRITLHTTANAEREIPWKVTGIHWHIANPVYYKSPDVQGREMPWVQVVKADGTRITYRDPESSLSDADLDKLEPRRMECFNCHNAVGHPFPNPADRVDEAIAAGRIDRALPSAKARAVALIDAAADVSGPTDERAKTIDRLLAENAAKFPTPEKLKEKDAQFQKVMREILLAASFEEKGVTWKSFPNHAGHKDFPGCFRCHNGKHVNEKGEAIRLQCTLCHNLPQVRGEKVKSTVPSTVSPDLTPPPSHEEPNFMHEHRTKLDDTCTMCHGKIEWGADGGSFCSNPACHGRKWPGMNLDPQAKK